MAAVLTDIQCFSDFLTEKLRLNRMIPFQDGMNENLRKRQIIASVWI